MTEIPFFMDFLICQVSHTPSPTAGGGKTGERVEKDRKEKHALAEQALKPVYCSKQDGGKRCQYTAQGWAAEGCSQC